MRQLDKEIEAVAREQAVLRWEERVWNSILAPPLVAEKPSTCMYMGTSDYDMQTYVNAGRIPDEIRQFLIQTQQGDRLLKYEQKILHAQLSKSPYSNCDPFTPSQHRLQNYMGLK